MNSGIHDESWIERYFGVHSLLMTLFNEVIWRVYCFSTVKTSVPFLLLLLVLPSTTSVLFFEEAIYSVFLSHWIAQMRTNGAVLERSLLASL